MQGYIHSVETGGTVDGPGIRFIVFTTGCPLSCQYCHNPDTQKLKNGTLRDVDELLAEIETYKSFFKRSGGGLTISGGEPLVQPAFTTALLEGAKARGIHTALDTSGFLGDRADDRLLAATDLVLLDIKSALPDVYKGVTGVDLQPTLDFANRLAAMNKPMWVRFVLVPGLTDAPENVEALAKFVAPFANMERLEVLPFHQMGIYKWQEMGMDYKLANTNPPTAEEMAAVKAIFKKYGAPVV